LQALELGFELLDLAMKVGQGLFLHVERLRHRVRRIGLLTDFFGDEALRLRVAGLIGDLLQTPENIRDDVAFLTVHG
jgi:hypothetical protein